MYKIDYSKLRSGDIVMTGGGGIFAALIRFFTAKGIRKSKAVTHVGILVDFNGQLLLAEMKKEGLSISSLEEYNSEYKYIVNIGRCFNMNDDKIIALDRIIAYDRRKTLDYDWKGILSFVTGTTGSKNKYYCSEYIAHLLRCVEIRFWPEERNISPEDISNAFKINLLGHMVHWREQ